MKNVIISVNRKILISKVALSKNYYRFLESKYFWAFSFLSSLIFLLYSPYFFWKIHIFLGLLFLIFAIFFMFTLIPAFYYKIQGIDFFKDVVVLKNANGKKSKTKDEIGFQHPISSLLIEDFYKILKSANLIDQTLIGDETEVDVAEVFSFEYVKSFIKEISEKGKTDKRLYLSTNQKMAGYILFDVLRPLIQKDVKSFSHLIYYSQKKSFKKVNYSCISDSNKRGIDRKVEALLPDLLKKVRSSK